MDNPKKTMNLFNKDFNLKRRNERNGKKQKTSRGYKNLYSKFYNN